MTPKWQITVWSARRAGPLGEMATKAGPRLFPHRAQTLDLRVFWIHQGMFFGSDPKCLIPRVSRRPPERHLPPSQPCGMSQSGVSSCQASCACWLAIILTVTHMENELALSITNVYLQGNLSSCKDGVIQLGTLKKAQDSQCLRPNLTSLHAM